MITNITRKNGVENNIIITEEDGQFSTSVEYHNPVTGFGGAMEAPDWEETFDTLEEAQEYVQAIIQDMNDEDNEGDRGITPHKGGRTEQVALRFTPDELATLDAARGDMSRPDYIVSLLEMKVSKVGDIYEVENPTDLRELVNRAKRST